MKQFSVLNAAGLVLRRGECASEHFNDQVQNDGETVIEGLHDFPDPTPVESYEGKRVREYPPIPDLIDALYWQSRGDLSKLADYFNRCEAVKRKHPKPLGKQ